MGAVYLNPGQDWWGDEEEAEEQPVQSGRAGGIPVPADSLSGYLEYLRANQTPPPAQTGGIGTLLGMGARQIPALLSGAGEWAAGQVGLEGAAEWLGEARRGWEQSIAEKAAGLAPSYQQGREKEWLTTDLNKAAWADPAAVAAQFTESLPLTLMSLVPGGVLLRGGASALKAATVMGGVEGALGVAEVANNIAGEIDRADERELMDSPFYAQLREQGVEDKEARQRLIAETQGVLKPVAGGAWSAAMGGLGGYGLGKLVSEDVGRGIAGRFGTGFVREAPTEAAQGAGTQVATNLAAQERGAERGTWEGVGEAAAGEGVIGGLSGGGFGVAIGRRKNVDPQTGTRDVTGNAGPETDAARQATAGVTTPETPEAPAARYPNPTQPTAQPSPLQTAEARQAAIAQQTGEAPVTAAPPPVAQAAEPPPAEAVLPAKSRFRAAAYELAQTVPVEDQPRFAELLGGLEKANKKGLYTKEQVAGVIEQMRRERLIKPGTPVGEVELGTEQGGQMRLPGFPLAAGLPPLEEVQAAFAPEVEQAPEGVQPDLLTATAEARAAARMAEEGAAAVARRQRRRTVQPAQAVTAEAIEAEQAAERAAYEMPAEVALTATDFTKLFTAPKARENASVMLNTLADTARTARQRDILRATAQSVLDEANAGQVGQVMGFLQQQGVLPAEYVGQLRAELANAPAAAAPKAVVEDPVAAAREVVDRITARAAAGEEKVYSPTAKKQVYSNPYPAEEQANDIGGLVAALDALRARAQAIGATVADTDIQQANRLLARGRSIAEEFSQEKFGEDTARTTGTAVAGKADTEAEAGAKRQGTMAADTGKNTGIRTSKAAIAEARDGLVAAIQAYSDAVAAVAPEQARAAIKQKAAQTTIAVKKRRQKEAAAEEKQVAEAEAADKQAEEMSVEGMTGEVAKQEGIELEPEVKPQVEPDEEANVGKGKATVISVKRRRAVPAATEAPAAPAAPEIPQAVRNFAAKHDVDLEATGITTMPALINHVNTKRAEARQAEAAAREAEAKAREAESKARQAEQAAREAEKAEAAKRPRMSPQAAGKKGQAQRKKVKATDTLLTLIGKRGGLNAEQARAEWGLDPADMKAINRNSVPGFPVFRTGDKGKSPDYMAETLREDGFQTDTPNDVFDLLSRAMRGEKILAPAHMTDTAMEEVYGLGEEEQAPAAEEDMGQSEGFFPEDSNVFATEEEEPGAGIPWTDEERAASATSWLEEEEQAPSAPAPQVALKNISAMTNEELESQHSWVQRAFPTTHVSSVVGSDYQLTAEQIEAIKSRPETRNVMETNVARFLDFFRSDPRAITKNFNHNYQRVSRALESLRTFGYRDLAETLYAGVTSAIRARGFAMPAADADYWRPLLASAPAARDVAGAIPDTGQRPLLGVPDVVMIGNTGAQLAQRLKTEGISGDVKTMKFTKDTAIVSPANTRGYMGGNMQGGGARSNIDSVYLEMFGPQLQQRVQQRIQELYGAADMPLNAAFAIRTYPEGQDIPDGRPGWFIVAPTMTYQETGMPPSATPDVAGQAMRNALRVAGLAGIRRVAVPAMGMGSAAGAPARFNDFVKAFDQAIEDADQDITDQTPIRRAHRATPGFTPADRANRASILQDTATQARLLMEEAADMYGGKMDDFTVLYHATNKDFANVVASTPEAKGPIKDPLSGRTTGRGFFTTESLPAVVDYALQHGIDDPGVVAYVVNKAQLNRWVADKSVIRRPNNWSVNNRTFEEYAFTDKVVQRGFFDDSRRLRAKVDAAQTELFGPSRQDTILGRMQASRTLAGLFDMTGDVSGTEEVNSLLRDRLDSNDPYRRLLEAIDAAGIGDIEVQVLNSEEMAEKADGEYASGLYEQSRDGKRVIYLNGDIVGQRNMVKVYLHELVHAATASGLTTDNELAQRMETLRQAVIKEMKKRGDTAAMQQYGLTNLDEFLAEAMTNSEFQRVLASVKTRGGNSSLWKDFIDAIASFLGFKVPRNTVLAEVVSATPRLFVPEADARRNLAMRRRSEYIAEVNSASTAEMAEWMRGDRADAQPPRAEQNAVKARMTATIVRRLASRPAAAAARRTMTAFIGTGMETGAEYLRMGKRGMLGLMTLDQLVREFKSLFNAENNPLTRYNETMRKKVHIARSEQLRAEELNKQWRDAAKRTPTKADDLNQLMLNATASGIHPDVPYTAPENSHLPAQGKPGYKDMVARHAELQRQYNALPGDLRKVYTDTRDYYAAQRRRLQKAALTRLAERFRLDPAQKQQMVNATVSADIDAVDLSNYAEVKDDLVQTAKHILDVTSVEGPYFPLRRFGKYVVEGVKPPTPVRVNGVRDEYGTRKDAWEAARTLRAKDPFNKVRTRKDEATGKYYLEKEERVVEMLDNVKQARDRAAELQADGFRHRDGGDMTATLKEEWNAPRGTAAHVLLAQATKGMDPDSAPAQALERAFLELLVENSVRKSELQRRKVAGASLDMRRAFAERAYAGSWAVADFETATAQHDALRDMWKAAKSSDRNAVQMGEVAHELQLRDQKSLEERKISSLEMGLSKLGFVWYLFSPSYTVVNLTQVPLVAGPYLAAKYGMGATMKALTRGYRDVYRAGAKELWDIKGGFRGTAESALDNLLKNGRFTADEKTMLTELNERGIIDSTFAQELVATGQGKDRGATEQVLDRIRAMPQLAELINRITVSKAAYQLARKAGNTHEKATEAAAEAVLQTQFDYSDLNKPRYFKSFTLARPIMMFKMYAQGMYMLTVGNYLKAVRGNGTEAEKAEARRMLAGILATHTFTAGILGGIFIEPVRLLLGIAAFLAGDKDEPWDLDNEVTQFLAGLTDAKTAELLTRGVPRAAGLDLSGRVGLNHMAFMGMPDARSYEEAWKNVVTQTLGPMAALSFNAARGADYIAKNEYSKGLELLVPKAVRDLLRASRLAEEGLTDYNGNVIADASKFSLRDSIVQALGFQTSTTARTYEGREAQKTIETELNDRRKSLMQQWRRADDRGAFFRDKVRAFNRVNPEFRITMAQLHTGLREQRRRERETRSGYSTEKRSIRDIGKAYEV